MGRKIKECNHCHLLKPTHGHGYCSTCCAGLRKNSSFIPYNLRPDIPKFTPCSVWDCNEQIRRKIHVGLYAGKSYCSTHGNRIKCYGEPLEYYQKHWWFPEDIWCKEQYCDNFCQYGLDLCTKHRQRLTKFGDTSYSNYTCCVTNCQNKTIDANKNLVVFVIIILIKIMDYVLLIIVINQFFNTEDV